MPSNKMSKKEASLSRAPYGLMRFSSWTWKDLMGIATIVIFAYQSNQVASLESQLAIQNAKIVELEQTILKISTPFNNQQLSTNSSTAINASSDKELTDASDVSKKDSKENDHTPHSHYAIEMRDGVPVNPDVEYTLADFESIFHVIPILGVEETPAATKLLNQNNVWEEKDYHSHFNTIAPLAAKVADFFEKLHYRKDNKMYVKWESKEIGFGLFTREPIKQGELVDIYAGVLNVDREDLNTEKNTDYMWVYRSKSGNYTDGVFFEVDGREKGNYLRFANHAGKNSNCKHIYLPFNNRWNIFYIAVKDISAGEAITVDYGRAYFEDRPLVE